MVCRMAKFGGSLNLILVFSFSSFERDIFLMYPLAVLLRRIYGLDLPTSSIVLGMRGAKRRASALRGETNLV